MPFTLKRINDPESVEKRAEEMKTQMKLREVKTFDKLVDSSGKSTEQSVHPSKDAEKAAETEKTKRVSEIFFCRKLLDSASDGVREERARTVYYAGKGHNKIFCGKVLQVVPTGGYAEIGGGKSVVSKKHPFDGNKYELKKGRQLLIKVGSVSKRDFVVVLAKNGCILLESESFAALNLPVFVVNKEGHYYYLNSGERLLTLHSGKYLIAYTKEMPILYVDVDNTTLLSDKPGKKVDSKLDSKSITSKESISGTKEDNKSKGNVKSSEGKSLLGESKENTSKLDSKIKSSESGLKVDSVENQISKIPKLKSREKSVEMLEKVKSMENKSPEPKAIEKPLETDVSKEILQPSVETTNYGTNSLPTGQQAMEKGQQVVGPRNLLPKILIGILVLSAILATAFYLYVSKYR